MSDVLALGRGLSTCTVQSFSASLGVHVKSIVIFLSYLNTLNGFKNIFNSK